MIIVRDSDGLVLHTDALTLDEIGVLGPTYFDITVNVITATIVDAPYGVPVSKGWYYADGAWLPPVDPGFDMDAARANLTAAVNADRDLRVRMPFTFAGKAFDYDEASQKRITGAAALAGFAMAIGGKAGDDLLWHGGADPFTWIAADNSLVPMDAATTLAFGQAAAAWESAHIFAARALKDAIAAAPDAAALAEIDISAGWPG